ncbi:MAG: FAD-binding and (Fe-S)-binding domain-containing protein [Verrucomicrobiia bacterium]
MNQKQIERLFKSINCEVAFDNLTRRLYATDASIYEILPLGVAFPKNYIEASALIKAAAEYSIPLTPRGAGSGLTGGAIGDGLIIDFSRHFKQISKPDIENRKIRVGAGVVLDSLNAYLKPYGFCFGPDVATSSRATIGGMIANDSSGARAPYYGTTAEHIISLNLITSDGEIVNLDRESFKLKQQSELAKSLVIKNADLIKKTFPSNLVKRFPGYALNRFLKNPDNLNNLICGSEGTLAIIIEAELKLTPLPTKKGIGVIFFNSVTEALEATVNLLELKPVAIEHVDKILFDQTRGQPEFKHGRNLLELDTKPCESFLIVEFYNDDVEERLEQLRKLNQGLRCLTFTDESSMNLVWKLRKAGLSLLTGCKGRKKPVTGIEDTAVAPDKLPEYIQTLESIFKPLGLNVCYYGHAASGCLHIRPVLDLRNAQDRKIFRQVADDVAKVISQYKGSLSAEHGVGIARTEYIESQLGKEIADILKQIKFSFDPKNLLNPGKIIDDGRYKIDTHLRLGDGYELKLPFEPRLKFRAKDESFTGNLEQCNGCGGCRKETPTMCPTFIATSDESLSTRGRANIIRAALDLRNIKSDAPIGHSELIKALGSCLSCKACATECPSNVNMALIKAELLNGLHKTEGVPIQAQIFGYIDILAKYASKVPELANLIMNLPPVRWALFKFADITDKRPLPRFSKFTFRKWFRNQKTPDILNERQKVILWDDTFTNYYEPEIGISALNVLETLGYEVILLKEKKCCGRPAFSQGLLDRVAALGSHNLNLLGKNKINGATFLSHSGEIFLTTSEIEKLPIIFLEPSCYSMFVEDYLELGLDNAEKIAERCFLFEEYIQTKIEQQKPSLNLKSVNQSIAVHIHCHIKSRMDSGFVRGALSIATSEKVKILDTACCGMAGAFGATESKYELSRQVGMMMARTIETEAKEAILIASGTSCRQQIEHLTGRKALHPAQLFSNVIAK